MTNVVKGEVPLKLKDGRVLTLVLDFEAFVVAEQLAGKPLHLLAVDVALGFLGGKRAMLYGAMRRHHPEIEPEDVGAMFAANELAINKALSAADQASFPDATEDKKPGKAPAMPRRGRNSGASGAKPGSNPTRSGAQPRAASR